MDYKLSLKNKGNRVLMLEFTWNDPYVIINYPFIETIYIFDSDLVRQIKLVIIRGNNLCCVGNF